MGDRPRCAENVWSGYHSFRCSRYALPGQQFCKQHSPEYKAEQRRKASERFNAKCEQRAAIRERDAVTLLRGLGYTVIAPGTPAGGDTDA